MTSSSLLLFHSNYIIILFSKEQTIFLKEACSCIETLPKVGSTKTAFLYSFLLSPHLGGPHGDVHIDLGAKEMKIELNDGCF